MTRRQGRHTKASGCDGKVTFESFSEAEKQAKRTGRRRNARICPYHCLFCHKYHVGNKVRQHRPETLLSN